MYAIVNDKLKTIGEDIIEPEIRKIILEWCSYHDEHPDKQIDNPKIWKVPPMTLPEFDMKLFDVDFSTFKKLRNATIYLRIHMLFRNLGRYVYIFSYNKSLPEIITKFQPDKFKNLSKVEINKLIEDWELCKDFKPNIDMDIDLDEYMNDKFKQSFGFL